MIKLFRNIRHRFVAENRFSKYLVYSIGEIVLVVIGILIALSINNWNEDKKDQKKVKVYYKQILEELDSDQSAIQFSIKRLQEDVKYFEGLNKELKAPNLTVDALLEIYGKADFIIDNTSFNTKTIDVLLSTGDINLLPLNIKNALLALQSDQLDHISDSKNRYDFYSDMVRQLDYLFPLNKALWENQVKLADKLKAKQKMILEIPHLNKTIFTKYNQNKADLLELENILNLTKELRRFVEERVN